MVKFGQPIIIVLFSGVVEVAVYVRISKDHVRITINAVFCTIIFISINSRLT